MHPKTFRPALLAASIAALTGAAGAALALAPGDYNVQGVQRICVQSGGTWYGESFGPWRGRYVTGPSGQTALFGNYQGGVGNDSFVIASGSSQWTEWKDGLSFSKFLVGPFTRAGAKCKPPAAMVTPGHENPMD